MWHASLKRQNNPPSASAAFEAFGCRCLVFLVLAPACTAVRFGLLLSTLSRLTHILYAVLDGSNFRENPTDGDVADGEEEETTGEEHRG